MSGRSDWYAQLPKVELHLHLEGAIPLDALWELVCKYGGHPATPNREALERLFIYQDFHHFLRTWTWKNQFLREYQDFTWIAEAVARNLASQNIRYVEAFYSPGDFSRVGLEVQRLTEAIRAGLSQVSGVEVALVVDLVRNYGPEKGFETLAAVNEARQ